MPAIICEKKKKTERVALGANAKTKKKKINKETEENDALSALSARLCARARARDLFFLQRESRLCQPMDLLVSSKFVLSQIDVLSF